MKIKTIYTFLFVLVIVSSTKGQDFNSFLNDANAFFTTHVQHNSVAYQVIHKKKTGLEALVQQIAKIDIQGLSELEQKAFYINAYNLLVIKNIINFYPITSPNEIIEFWDKIELVVSGEKHTLKALKIKILQNFQDKRLHFVLSDGTISSAPIISKAYMPIDLEEQIESRCIEILNNSKFILYNKTDQELIISSIFKEQKEDFNPYVLTFINLYRMQKIDTLVKIKYDNNDTRLNDLHAGVDINIRKKNGITSYSVLNSMGTVCKGCLDLSIYNSVFALTTGDASYGSRNSFLSSFITANYGINGRLDVGIMMMLRSSRMNDLYENSPFKVFEFERNIPNPQSHSRNNPITYSDWAFSHLGVQVQFAPFKKLNLIFQQGIMLPLKDLPKDNTVDENIYIISQVQFTHTFSSKLHLFLTFGFWQGITVGQEFRFSPPTLKCFLSYYITPRIALMVTTMYFWEWGAGIKFQVTPRFELQAIYSYFLPIPELMEFISPGTTSAMTYNLGLRYRF